MTNFAGRVLHVFVGNEEAAKVSVQTGRASFELFVPDDSGLCCSLRCTTQRAKVGCFLVERRDDARSQDGKLVLAHALRRDLPTLLPREEAEETLALMQPKPVSARAPCARRCAAPPRPRSRREESSSTESDLLLQSSDAGHNGSDETDNSGNNSSTGGGNLSSEAEEGDFQYVVEAVRSTHTYA